RVTPSPFMTSSTTVRDTPRKMLLSAGRVMILLSAVTIQALDEEPSVTKPPLSTNQASRAPCSFATCLASTFGRSDTDLMSTPGQRLSGTVTTDTPFTASLSPRERSIERAVITSAGGVPSGG